jgi:hypothetical protein
MEEVVVEADAELVVVETDTVTTPWRRSTRCSLGKARHCHHAARGGDRREAHGGTSRRCHHAMEEVNAELAHESMWSSVTEMEVAPLASIERWIKRVWERKRKQVVWERR